MSFLNLFRHIKFQESRPTLLQRILNTYEFFAGRYAYGGFASPHMPRDDISFIVTADPMNYDTNLDHLGFVDLFLLPYLFSVLSYYTTKFVDAFEANGEQPSYSKKAVPALYVLAVALNAVVNFLDNGISIFKGLIAGFLTVLVLPIVMGVHAISKIKSLIMDELNGLEGNEEDTDEEDTSFKEKFLRLWNYKKVAREENYENNINHEENKNQTSLNPFYGVIETWKAPNARTYRTDLKQKMIDTYHVFAGKDTTDQITADDFEEASSVHIKRIGLFDIALLMLPYLLKSLYHNICRFEQWSKKHSQLLYWSVALPVKAIFFIPYHLNETILRPVVSFAAMLSVFPIVGIVQLIAQAYKGQYLNAELKKIQIRKELKKNEDKSGIVQGPFLEIHEIASIEDLKIVQGEISVNENAHFVNEEKVKESSFSESSSTEKLLIIFEENKELGDRERQKQFSLEFDLKNTDDQYKVATLLRLNVGGCVNYFETQKCPDRLRTDEAIRTEADYLFSECVI